MSSDGGRAADDRPSIGELLTEVSDDLTTLLHQEVELAKAEVRESASRAGRGAGLLAGSALALDLTLMFLSLAAWWWLGDPLGRGWSAVVVAAVWAVIGAVLGAAGRGALRSISGMPRTADSVSRIPQAMTGHEEMR